MSHNNIIVNGSFNLRNTGWNGTDLETKYTKADYLFNGSRNRVAEMDGHGGQTTAMQQTVTIARPLDTTLTFESALRNQSAGQAAREGLRVDVLDDEGQVIATQSFLPNSTGFTTCALPVNFPEAKSCAIRLTELGPDDSLGAIVDNMSMLVCFTAGTMIDTPVGPRAVERLVPGDEVWTQDAGHQPVVWIGQRRIDHAAMLADPALRPVVFLPGSLEHGLPDRRMRVSPQHRLCRGRWQVELQFGQPQVLVPAQGLIKGTTIHQLMPDEAVTYEHFLLNGHQIVRSSGVLSESFFPSALALTGLERAARSEVLRFFPDLEDTVRRFPQNVRRVPRTAEARLVA